MLLVLPCPWRCLCITYECYHACKLLLCGDIECNPGPTVEYMFERIIETQKAIQQDISNLMTMQHTLRESLETLSARMNNVDKVFMESQASLNPIAPIEQHMRLLQQSFGTQHRKLALRTTAVDPTSLSMAYRKLILKPKKIWETRSLSNYSRKGLVYRFLRWPVFIDLVEEKMMAKTVL